MTRGEERTDDRTLLDHPLIAQRYFFPMTANIPAPFWVECGDARLACHLHRVAPEAKTVVHFHGNGEVVADYLDGFPNWIGQMGCNCLLAEYRGYGSSTGSPRLGRMLDDVARIIETLGQPAKQLVFFGRSVGSLFALRAADLMPDAAGLILESAIADLLERLLLRVSPAELGVDQARMSVAISRTLDIPGILGRFAGPVLIMHTRHDGLIDVTHAERLAGWCPERAQLEIFERGCHNNILHVNQSRYLSLVRDFLAAL